MKNARHIRFLTILALFAAITFLICACKEDENTEAETGDIDSATSVSETETDPVPDEIKWDDIFLNRIVETEAAPYNTIEPVEGLAGRCVSHAGDLALFADTHTADEGYVVTTDLYLFSGKTNTILYNCSRIDFGDTSGYDAYNDVSIIGSNLYMVVEYHDGIFSSTVYNVDNQKLLTSEKEITVTGDILTADNVKCVIDDGQLLPWSPILSGLSMSSDEPDAVQVTEKYRHQFTSRTAVVYDENGVMKGFYEFPSYADNTAVFPLNNGNVLLQYVVEVKQIDGIKIQPEEYDFEQNDVKYKLYSLLLDAETGKTIALTLDCLISELITRYSLNENGQQVTDKVENIAFIIPIENQQVDTSNEVWTLMDNDGTTEALEKWVAGQDGNPQLISDGIFVVSTQNGRRYLFDSNRKMIGDVTGSTVRNGYVITNTTVFDCFGHALVDLAADGFTVDTVADSGVWLRKTMNGNVTNWLLSDGDLMIKADGVNQVLSYRGSDMYAIYDVEKDVYRYIGTDGDQLGQFREPLKTAAVLNNCVLYTCESGSRIYILHNGNGTSYVENQLTYTVETAEDGTVTRTYEDGARQVISNNWRSYYPVEIEDEIGVDHWPINDLADQMMHAYEGVIWFTDKQMIHVWQSNETYIISLFDANKEYLMTTKGFTVNEQQSEEGAEQVFWSAENEAGYKIAMYIEDNFLAIVCIRK